MNDPDISLLKVIKEVTGIEPSAKDRYAAFLWHDEFAFADDIDWSSAKFSLRTL
ncbi:MAG: hypothetical protein AAFQ82_21800 [Myxococcota bacterium]